MEFGLVLVSFRRALARSEVVWVVLDKHLQGLEWFCVVLSWFGGGFGKYWL